MATYEQIQDEVKRTTGRQPKTCWIAHAKELCGIPVKKSHRRRGERKYPCPDEMLPPIRDAFKHFRMM